MSDAGLNAIFREVHSVTSQIVRELSYPFREGLRALKADRSGYEFLEQFAPLVQRLLFSPLDQGPLAALSVQGEADPRRALVRETFRGLGVEQGTAQRYADALMESRAGFGDDGQPLAPTSSRPSTTHWRALLGRWNPIVFAAASRTLRLLEQIHKDASAPYAGTDDDPDDGVSQTVDLMRRFPDVAERVYFVLGFSKLRGFPPQRTAPAAGVGLDPESRFAKAVQEQIDGEWWTNMFCAAGLVVVAVGLTVLSFGTLGPAAAALVGAGLGTAQGGFIVARRSHAVAEGRVAVRMGAMDPATLEHLERELNGAWAMLLIDAATGGLLGRFGGTTILSAALRGTVISGANGGLNAAVDPNVWDSEDRVALILLGTVIGAAVGGAGSAAGAGVNEVLQRNLRIQLAVDRAGGTIRPGRVVRLSVGRNAEPVDATVIRVERSAHAIVVSVRGREYTVRIDRAIDIRNHSQRLGPATPGERNPIGRDYEITPIRPDRAPVAPTSALTPSAREALARPNVLLMRAYGGPANSAMTNQAGRSWWRRVDMEYARVLIEGMENGRPGSSVEHALVRYGIRPADPNVAEIWLVDMHSLLRRNPGANAQIDGLGDLVLTTARPETLLNSVRRYRFVRRTPVDSYWDIIR